MSDYVIRRNEKDYSSRLTASNNSSFWWPSIEMDILNAGIEFAILSLPPLPLDSIL